MSAFDDIREGIKAECEKKGFPWPPQDAAARVAETLDRLELAALDPARLYSGVLVGVGGEHDTPPNDEQCKRAAELIGKAIRRAMGPGYITQAEARLLRAIGDSRVCACVSDEHADLLVNAGFARPVCAVHPDGGGDR